MNLTIEPSRKLHQKLTEILSDERAYLAITFFDGSTYEIKPEKNATVEVGLDYLLIEVEIDSPGPLPYAPRIIPFTSMKTIDVII